MSQRCKSALPVWRKNFGTLPLQLQKSHQSGLQDRVASKEKESSACTMAGVELEKCTTCNDVSNQQSQTQEILSKRVRCALDSHFFDELEIVVEW